MNHRNASDAAERIQQITGPRGAGLALDCVGVQPTLDLGAKLLGRNSMWMIVGLGGGSHDFRHGSTPYGTSMSIPYWGSRLELMEVIAMARAGRIHRDGRLSTHGCGRHLCEAEGRTDHRARRADTRVARPVRVAEDWFDKPVLFPVHDAVLVVSD